MEIGKNWKHLYKLIPEKRKRKICIIAHCRNKTPGEHTICVKHRIRRWRVEHPLYAAFLIKKHNAKNKKVGFELTFQEFKKFARETGYDNENARKGKFGLTIERIDAREPYRIGNIEILTRSENSIKGQKDKIDAYLMSKI